MERCLLIGLRPQLPASCLFAHANEAAVDPVFLYELVVRAALHDAAGVHDEDLVGVAHRVQAMGDGDERLAARKLADRFHEQMLVLRVDGAGRLVQDDDRSVLHDSARDGYALPFATRQVSTTLLQHGVVSLRKPLDEIVAPRPLRRSNHLIARGVGASEPYVVLHRVIEQIYVLKHQRHMRKKAFRRALTHIHATHTHTPFVNVPEAREQIHQRGLARPAGSHDGA